MAVKALDVYQGNDWLTYRWSVAQVFDTLDRIRDVCLHMPQITCVPPEAQSNAPPRYDVADSERIDMFGCLVGFCDDLVGELDAVLADVCPPLPGNVQQRWMGFEMQLHLEVIRQKAWGEHQAQDGRTTDVSSSAAVDIIMALASRMRDLLKQIDA